MSREAAQVMDEAERIEKRFLELCEKTNSEKPRPADVKALAKMLEDHEGMELWRRVASAAYIAESMVLKNAPTVPALKENWKYRMESLKKELGSVEASPLERLLIQQAALCWLKLNMIEVSYSNVMKQSITLTLGMYWEKRLTAAQKRFTRACESLARVRKLSCNTPALQVNIAADGGQQVNVTK